MDRERYNAIDWLKVVCCIGIMLMHIKANTTYDIPGFFYNRIVPSFTDFVFVFMAISSFGLCCGYYQKFTDGSIILENFYKKRYLKILPFFIAVILIDLCFNFSKDSLLQGFVELTLFHGFIPVSFSVIGVAWFLGVVFIFYLSFPFFCVLLKTKARGWISFSIAVGLSIVCQYHFNLGRINFAASFCFFFIGGLIYLYKDKVSSIKTWICALVLVLSVVPYYLQTNTITRVVLTATILLFAVSLKAHTFKTVTFFSNISMEIYLCHMAVFRVLEKLHLLYFLGQGVAQYLFTCIAVFLGSCAMSVCINVIINHLHQFFTKNKYNSENVQNN